MCILHPVPEEFEVIRVERIIVLRILNNVLLYTEFSKVSRVHWGSSIEAVLLCTPVNTLGLVVACLTCGFDSLAALTRKCICPHISTSLFRY